jgi:hypothetical protein
MPHKIVALAAECCIRLHPCFEKLGASPFEIGPRIRIINENTVRTQEHVILNRHALPQRHSILHRDIVSQRCATFDERVIADIATRSYVRTSHYMGKCRDPSTPSDVARFNQRLRMHKHVAAKNSIAG